MDTFHLPPWFVGALGTTDQTIGDKRLVVVCSTSVLAEFDHDNNTLGDDTVTLSAGNGTLTKVSPELTLSPCTLMALTT